MRSLAPSIENQAAGVGGNAETSVRTRTDRPVWLLTVKTAADRPAASRTMALVVVVIENAESIRSSPCPGPRHCAGRPASVVRSSRISFPAGLPGRGRTRREDELICRVGRLLGDDHSLDERSIGNRLGRSDDPQVERARASLVAADVLLDGEAGRARRCIEEAQQAA